VDAQSLNFAPILLNGDYSLKFCGFRRKFIDTLKLRANAPCLFPGHNVTGKPIL